MSQSTLAGRNHRRQSKQSSSEASNGSRNGHAEADLLHSIRRLGSDVSRSMKSRAKDLGETANAYLKRGRKKAGKLEQAIERRVVKRPLAAVLAAAGVGLVIGMFCRRRS